MATGEKVRSKGFTPTEVAAITKINYNTILYWLRMRILRAPIRYEGRQRSPIHFSFQDLVEIGFVAELRKIDVRRGKILQALRVLRANKEAKYIDVSGEEARAIPIEAFLLLVVANRRTDVINVELIRDELAEGVRTRIP